MQENTFNKTVGEAFFKPPMMKSIPEINQRMDVLSNENKERKVTF